MAATETEQISSIRRFNRFYTARLGLLQKRHLDSRFSLTEARILYEIGAGVELTASVLRTTLRLDAGYLSRLLASLASRRLIRQTPSKLDRRERLLTLSPLGRKAVAQLDEQSSSHIQELLAGISPAKRDALVNSLSEARSILSDAVQIIRLPKVSDEAIHLLHEYYEAVHVVLRDSPQAVQKILKQPASGFWLAYLDNEAVGCVLLKKLSAIAGAGECKRLYVKAAARGHGIADRLMDALEKFARDQGLRAIYLDTYDDLKAALSLYRKRGYVSCPRYNNNPQATVFLRKDI